MVEHKTRREKRINNKSLRTFIGNRADVRGHKKIKQTSKRGTAHSQKARR